VKRKISLTLIALALAACAHTPAPDLRKDGISIKGRSSLSPSDLAMCFAANAESQARLMTTLRPGPAVGHLEMLAFTVIRGDMTVVIAADIQPAGVAAGNSMEGSFYTLTTTRGSAPERVFQAVTDGC